MKRERKHTPSQLFLTFVPIRFSTCKYYFTEGIDFYTKYIGGHLI